MQFYECLCLCAVISAATGAIRPFSERLYIPAFSLAFAGVLTWAFSRFSFAPFPELRCNAAVFFLPAYLLASAADAGRKNPLSRPAWQLMSVFSLLPVIGTLLGALYALYREDYAAVDLGTVALLNAMTFFAAAAFLFFRLYAAIKERKEPA